MRVGVCLIDCLAPLAAACAADTYGATPGLETCTACPENSGTGGETGQTEVGACLCAAGWTGELTEPESTCEGCAADTYKPAAGPEACTACPENSGTGGETEQTEVSACLCAAGYEGEITTAESECTACLAGTWLGEIGPGPCTPCTENAVTEEAASTAITDCLCAAGHTGGRPPTPTGIHIRTQDLPRAEPLDSVVRLRSADFHSRVQTLRHRRTNAPRAR